MSFRSQNKRFRSNAQIARLHRKIIIYICSRSFCIDLVDKTEVPLSLAPFSILIFLISWNSFFIPEFNFSIKLSLIIQPILLYHQDHHSLRSKAHQNPPCSISKYPAHARDDLCPVLHSALFLHTFYTQENT